ncbi:hypothetical protein [Kitasatospora sp. NPDC017646]
MSNEIGGNVTIDGRVLRLLAHLAATGTPEATAARALADRLRGPASAKA